MVWIVIIIILIVVTAAWDARDEQRARGTEEVQAEQRRGQEPSFAEGCALDMLMMAATIIGGIVALYLVVGAIGLLLSYWPAALVFVGLCWLFVASYWEQRKKQ